MNRTEALEWLVENLECWDQMEMAVPDGWIFSATWHESGVLVKKGSEVTTQSITVDDWLAAKEKKMQTVDEKLEVIRHWLEGGDVEYIYPGGDWELFVNGDSKSTLAVAFKDEIRIKRREFEDGAHYWVKVTDAAVPSVAKYCESQAQFEFDGDSRGCGFDVCDIFEIGTKVEKPEGWE